ncbi:MAG: hypothetical protein RL071_1937 [Pseudomonadota bacterium]
MRPARTARTALWIGLCAAAPLSACQRPGQAKIHDEADSSDGTNDDGGDGNNSGALDPALQLGPVQTCAAPLSSPAYVEQGEALGFLPRDVDDGSRLGGSSIAALDLDQDGDIDVVESRRGSIPRVYWREGAQFEDALLLTSPADGRVRPLDLDNDGWTDLVQTDPDFWWPGGPDGIGGSQRLRIGDGELSVIDLLPLDLNRDGTLELFAAIQSMDPSPDPRRDGVLWGDLEAGWALEALPAPESAGNAAHASAVDWDQDGDLEVMVTNDMGGRFGGNQLWAEDEGWFRLRAAPGCLPTVSGMGQAFGDVDNDGDEDLYVGATFEPKLLRHEDDHSCVDLTAVTRANPLVERAPSLGPMVWAAVFLDHDNDGRLDLLLTEGDLINPPGEGDVLPAYPSPIDLLVQQPDGTFVDQGASLGLAREGSHRGALAEDLNDDGVLDLLVAEADRPLQVYLSTGCLAAAHLRIEAPEGTVARVQIDGLERFGVVRAEQGVGAWRSPSLHLGLGAAEAVDRIELRAPSGAMIAVDGPISARRTLRWTP